MLADTGVPDDTVVVVEHEPAGVGVRTVVVTVLGALVIAFVLNAPWLARWVNAHGSGWTQTVATPILERGEQVSTALHADQLRKRTETFTERVVQQRRGGDHRVLVVGDSFADGLGVALRTLLETGGDVRVDIDARFGTTWGDRHLQWWETRLEGAVDGYDVVVVSLGPPLSGGGVDATPDSDTWRDWWATQLDDMVTAAGNDGADVYVLGRPAADDPAVSELWTATNQVTAEAAARNDGFTFVRTFELVGSVDVDGHSNVFTATVTIDGRDVVVRDADGTHFTIAGNDALAADIVERHPEIGVSGPR